MSEACNYLQDIRKGSLSFPNSQTVKFNDEIASFSFKHNYFLKVSETSKLSEKEFLVLDALILPDDIWERVREKWIDFIQRDYSELQLVNQLFEKYKLTEGTIGLDIIHSAFDRLKSKIAGLSESDYDKVFHDSLEKEHLLEFKEFTTKQVAIFEQLRIGLVSRLNTIRQAMEIFERVFQHCVDKPQETENLRLLVDTLGFYALLTNELKEPVKLNGFNPLALNSPADLLLEKFFETSVSLIIQSSSSAI